MLFSSEFLVDPAQCEAVEQSKTISFCGQACLQRLVGTDFECDPKIDRPPNCPSGGWTPAAALPAFTCRRDHRSRLCQPDLRFAVLLSLIFFVFYFSGNREKHVRNAPTAFCVEKYKRTRLFSVMSRAPEVEDKHAIPFIRQGTSNSVVEVQE